MNSAPGSSLSPVTGRSHSPSSTGSVSARQTLLTGGQPPAAVTYSPLLPLFLLLFSGLYLFALPYLGRWRGRQVT